jgi:hypothetical protein
MKKILLIYLIGIFIFGISTNQVFAQRKVYLCENYTSSGQPVKPDIEWTMKPTGGGVYILYTNNGEIIPWTTMYVFIDKLTDGEYKEYDTKTVNPDKSKSWYVYDYSFKEKGSYRVTIYDQDVEKLASQEFTILIKSADGTDQQEVTQNSGASVIFCASLDEDKNPVDKGETFYVDRTKGSYIYIYIDNDNIAFNTEGLIVDLWKGNDYADFVDTKNLTIETQWTATYFKYTFMVAGDYKIMVYRKDQSYIQSGYVTIKYN